ncbi:hypothetical protein BDZ45DRAFT_750782 [Acephala macrosclerotiorum]|nr:hypothetical protein BDZ45DRAFT_750782 [Acephala macrosclerotiorum]
MLLKLEQRHYNTERPYVVTPPNSRIITTANPSTIPRTRTIRRRTRDTAQITDARRDGVRVRKIREWITEYVIALFEPVSPGIVDLDWRKVGLKVRIDRFELGVDFLGGAVYDDGGTARCGLDFPGEGDYAVAGYGRVFEAVDLRIGLIELNEGATKGRRDTYPCQKEGGKHGGESSEPHLNKLVR